MTLNSDEKEFSTEEIKFLNEFEEMTSKGEMEQVKELFLKVNNKRVIAKTYWVYHSDWQKHSKTMLANIESGNIPSDVSSNVYKRMHEIIGWIMRDKLSLVESLFNSQFNDNINDYVNLDKNPSQGLGCLGVISIFVVSSILPILF